MLEMVLFGMCGFVLGMLVGFVDRLRSKADFIKEWLLFFIVLSLVSVLLFYFPVVRYSLSVFYGFFVGFVYEAVEKAINH